jgi:hypothetical protein
VSRNHLTPAERRVASQASAHQSWADTDDWSARTAPARKAAEDRFLRQVDPDGTLPPAERAKRAEQARLAYFKALAFKSAKARRLAKESRALADETEAS